MSIAEKAVWVIERNSGQELTLAAIAKSCGVSRSLLANAFGAEYGCSVMKYLRARRLSKAAGALAQGASDILTVALDTGYGSHEAFTRAFRDQFSVTPEFVRDRGSHAGLSLMDPLEFKSSSKNGLEKPTLKSDAAIRIVGLPHKHSYDSTGKIPAQWQDFMTYYHDIPDKLDRIPVGVFRTGDGDGEGQFEYLCGAEVSRFGPKPQGLINLEIAPRNYAVFEHHGHVSKIFDTYSAIWNRAISSLASTVADSPVIERHNPSFDPRTGEGGLTIWVPLNG
jgi:AraC family transcriptional regulator